MGLWPPPKMSGPLAASPRFFSGADPVPHPVARIKSQNVPFQRSLRHLQTDHSHVSSPLNESPGIQEKKNHHNTTSKPLRPIQKTSSHASSSSSSLTHHPTFNNSNWSMQLSPHTWESFISFFTTAKMTWSSIIVSFFKKNHKLNGLARKNYRPPINNKISFLK